MTRSRVGAFGAVALIGLAAFALPADAKVKPHHTAHHYAVTAGTAQPRIPSFPTYIDRGADRNPGGDDLYFSDTRYPDEQYIVGPAYFQRWWTTTY
jgi:hypothetical protein